MRPRDCAETEPLLVDLAEGCLDTNQADRIERHLARCDACTTLLSDLKRSGTLLERIAQEQEREFATVAAERTAVPRRPSTSRSTAIV